MTSVSVSSGRCPRCSSPLSIPQQDPECHCLTTPLDCGVELDADLVSIRPPVDLNEWAVTERLKRIERLLGRELISDPEQQGNESPQHRIDVPHLASRSILRRPGAEFLSSRRISGGSTAGLWVALMFALAGFMAWIVGLAASMGLPGTSLFLPAGLAIPLQTAGICFLLVSILSAVAGVSLSNRRFARRLHALETFAAALRNTAKQADPMELRPIVRIPGRVEPVGQE